MKREANDGGSGRAGKCNIARARADHVLKGALKFGPDSLHVDAFKHRLGADLQQLGDAIQRPALNAHPVQLPRILLCGTVEMRVMAVHPEERAGSDRMPFASNLNPAAAFEAENQFVTWIGLSHNAVLMPRLQMARTHHGIKQIPLPVSGSGVKILHEDGFLHERSHGRIIHRSGPGCRAMNEP